MNNERSSHTQWGQAKFTYSPQILQAGRTLYTDISIFKMAESKSW